MVQPIRSCVHSNAAKYRKIWRTRQRTFLRMIGEYGPRSTYYVNIDNLERGYRQIQCLYSPLRF